MRFLLMCSPLMMKLEEMSLCSEQTSLLEMSLVILSITVDHSLIALKIPFSNNSMSLKDLIIRFSLPMRLSQQTLFEHTRTIQNHMSLVSIKDTFLMRSIILLERMCFRSRMCFRTKVCLSLMMSSQTTQHVGIRIMKNALRAFSILIHLNQLSLILTLFVMMAFD